MTIRRNRATVRHILWSKRLRFGEFHCALSLHNWSMLILPYINIWADLCFYSYRISTKEPCYCETYSIGQVLESWCVSLYTFTAQLKHVYSTIWTNLCFYSYRRLTKEPCYCETHSMAQVIEIWWVSLYTITAQLKHVNSTINQCLSFVSIRIGDRLRNRATVRRILLGKCLRVGVFLLYTFTAQLKHVYSTIWTDLCFYS